MRGLLRISALLALAVGLAACGGAGTSAAGSGATPPAITAQPQNQTAAVGSSATFSVTATGTAPLAYQWSKNGSVIAGANSSIYTTPAAALGDNGASFTVAVSNSAGSLQSAAATLNVIVAGGGNTDVTTYHNDALRSGQNLTESVLTTANVNPSSFGLLRKLAVDGKVDAQPLVLAQWSIGGALHDVVFVATEHDSVYAFDADTGATLWQESMLAAGESPSDAHGCYQVTPEIGITATPVIDRAAGTIYLVAMSKDSGGHYFQRLHALNLATGAERPGSPVTIAASVTATGAPAAVNGQIVFNPGSYKERSALLLNRGTIYTSWASHCDEANYTGWIIAYDEATLQQTAIFNTNPSGNLSGIQGEAAFWNSNSGPSADSAGNIYAMTGNGAFDTTLNAQGFPSGNDFGNAILKLTAPAAGTMTVLDYFTMYNTVAESASDGDLGSGGLMLLPDQMDASGATRHLAIGAGKDRNLYLVDRDNMGKFNAADNSNAYQVLTSALSYNGNACASSGLATASGEYGAPVYFNGTVYFGGSDDVIRAYRLTQAKLPSAPTMQTGQAFCYPGAPLSISANGTANAILWAVGNSLTQGILHAYDANDLGTELYNSAQAAGGRDQFGPGSKFTPPTVANGKVFVGTQATGSTPNVVAVFGLL